MPVLRVTRSTSKEMYFSTFEVLWNGSLVRFVPKPFWTESVKMTVDASVSA